MKILKFGGTSVGSVNSIRTLVDIVKDELKKGGKIAVVTSAMGGVTNVLLEIAGYAEVGKDFGEMLKSIEHQHLGVIRELIEVKKQNPAILQLKMFFNELEEILMGVRAIRELSPKTLDGIAAYGELCSTFMISKILEQYEPKTQFIDAREWIKTDDQFGNAKVNFKITDPVIRQFFQTHPDSLCCITGFIASNDKNQTTTLGRGGSDYTAAIIGAAVSCQEIQIWTDVDGFMTADPRMVKKAFTLPEISYTEAMELSYFGAKVIYPPTMTPVFLKKIPIRIRNTFNPEFPGTVIKEQAYRNGNLIRGISSINEISLINVEGSGLVGRTGFSGRLFSLLARENINIILITQASSEHSISLAVSPGDADRAKTLIETEFELELLTAKMEAPVLEGNLSILAIVGENMKHTPGLSGKLFHSLGRNGVNVVAIAQGSSEFNISVVINKLNLAKALNAVHDAFFVSTKKTLHVFYLGVGNIGKTLLNQMRSHEGYLLENNSLRLKVMGITNTRTMVIQDQGIDLGIWEKELHQSGEPADLETFVQRMKDLNLPNSVFLDNSASEKVIKYYDTIFQSNISIVTCNKLGNSGNYAQYQRFRDSVKKYGVDFYYETNVGAGLPIISTLRDLLVSGDKILKIEAILSGTISFIFNQFRGDMAFHDIVKEAQQRGYTEPDPRDDLSGMDFMRKMLILARDSGYAVEMEDIDMEKILPENCLRAKTIADFYEELKKSNEYFEKLKSQAETHGKVLRYIGILENGQVQIKLKMIDSSHPFYSLSGSDNIISFTTERYQDRPLVVKGPGAGAAVTAAGVFADLVKVGAR
ncbi:MAG: bifunctional aspartate kinase/homoserine dehydrogenase I [Chitinophagaceae bacterium]